MRIPFEIPEVDEVHEAAGYVYLEDEYLVFEFHVLNWGITKGEQTIVKAERGVVDGIRAQPGWFKDRLLIETHNTRLLKEIPGTHVAAIELRTKKRHRLQVGQFIELVQAWKREKPV